MAVAPSPWGQAGPVKAHRQALESEESQEPAVEDVYVLKRKSPPLLLLLVS